jgi:hypothetical protein
MKTLGEAISVYRKALVKLEELIEEDDGLNPKRTRRLKKAYEIIDGGLDGLESVGEWD